MELSAGKKMYPLKVQLLLHFGWVWRQVFITLMVQGTLSQKINIKLSQSSSFPGIHNRNNVQPIMKYILTTQATKDSHRKKKLSPPEMSSQQNSKNTIQNQLMMRDSVQIKNRVELTSKNFM